ncbi:MAG TPA: VTT domain-containing protein [Candidatus Paceibacterota bacterium]|nr:VTT domain-containing protein [Candidatus Paceibacterota bacterium]
MNSLVHWFQTVSPMIGQYRYPLLAGITVIEGTVSLLVVGVLAAAGVLSPWATFVSCLIGSVIGGYFWYGVGYWAGAGPLEKFMHSSEVRRALFERIREHSERAAGIIVFLAKLGYAITVPTLIIVGSLRFDLKRYSLANAAGTLIWVSVLFWVSFFAGKPAVQLVANLRVAGIIVVIAVVGVLSVWLLRVTSSALIRRVQAGIKD